MNAVRKAVQDAVGAPTAMAKKTQIEQLFSPDKNANTYVINSSVEVLDRSGQDGSSTVTLGVRINLEAVSTVLRANDIYGDQVLPQGGEVVLADQEAPSFAQATKASSSGEGEGGSEEASPQKLAAADTSGQEALDPEKEGAS